MCKYRLLNLSIILGVFVSSLVAGNKEIVVLDAEGSTGWYNSMTLYRNTVMVTYFDARFFRLKLAKCDVGNKFCERQRSVLIENNPDWFASLKVNETTAVTSYYDARTRQLNLLTCHITDTFCADPNIVFLDTDGDVGSYSSLALQGDLVFVSYYDASLGDLKILKCQLNNLACDSIQIATVDSVGDVGQFSSLAVSGNTALISYYDASTFQVKLAQCNLDGNLCERPQIVTVDQSPSFGLGWYLALALGEDGTAVMSYYDAANADLKLATCSTGSKLCETRQIVTVDSADNVGLYTSLALQTDRAVISYYDATNGDLKLAICSLGGQLCDERQIVVLDSDGNVGRYTSLLIYRNQAIVSYQDVTKGDLKVAKYQLS